MNRVRMRVSGVYIFAISVIGWIAVAGSLPEISMPDHPEMLLTLLLFIGITELFPISVWKGNSSLSVPILYTAILLYELPIVILGVALMAFLASALRKRPIPIMFFDSAVLVISLMASYSFIPQLMSWVTDVAPFYVNQVFLHLFLFILIYYVVHHLLVDLAQLIRPKPYLLMTWLGKTFSEITMAGLAYLYGYLMIRLGQQDRGPIDFFTIFFFFSPLVGISLLSSFNVRLQKQRNRLADLYSVTIDLNKKLASDDWLEVVKSRIKEITEVDALLLWIKENDNRWTLAFQDGEVEGAPLSEKVISFIESTKTTIVYPDRKKSLFSPHLFSTSLNSFVFAPMTIENETVGMLAAARERSHSFSNADVRSLTSMASQFAVIVKTKKLIAEQEKNKIFEERNRIARDIHDGIAQSLAGAVMNLEIASRKFKEKPKDSERLVNESVSQLRNSLKELRNSIYALRPYPTERVGLKQAIEGKIVTMKNQKDIDIVLETRGEMVPLDPKVERTMFEIFQEAVTNAIKHSKADRIDILLSYQKQNVLLKIHDDGVGFSLFDAMIKARVGKHFGILNMNEQAEKFGATLQIDSKEGKGTTIEFSVPKKEGVTVNDQRSVSR